jgi:hypothetical protein
MTLQSSTGTGTEKSLLCGIASGAGRPIDACSAERGKCRAHAGVTPFFSSTT